MDTPAWLPITIYAIILMGFLGVYSWHHDEEGIGLRSYSILVFLTAFLLLNDFISRFYVFDHFPQWIIILCTYINFSLLPVIGVQWYQYVVSLVTPEERQGARILNGVVFLIAAIGILVLLITPFTGAVFSFDTDGLYHRGPLFIFPAGATFLCIVIAEVFLLFRVRSLGPRVFATMLVFPIPPLAGGVAAMFVYGVPWMPLGISLSMVVLFANIHTAGLGRDYLTGVYNRRRMEEFMEDLIRGAKTGRSFAGMMIDIDNFKSINDQLGHAVGDTALSDAVSLLREALRPGDVLGRYGGDEFMVLLDVSDEHELESIVERMEAAERRFNSDEHAYLLWFSKGYAIFDPEKFRTSKDFEEHLDKLMYACKQKRKLDDTRRSLIEHHEQ